jgi:hypothetical protein
VLKAFFPLATLPPPPRPPNLLIFSYNIYLSQYENAVGQPTKIFATPCTKESLWNLDFVEWGWLVYGVMAKNV